MGIMIKYSNKTNSANAEDGVADLWRYNSKETNKNPRPEDGVFRISIKRV
jgi:hypothetical protein